MTPTPIKPDDEQRAEVRLSDETIRYIAETTAVAVANAIASSVGPAVTAGIDAAITDEKAKRVFEVGWRTMQDQMRMKAGGWLLGGFSSTVSKGAWIAVFVIGLYMAFGWQGLVAGWKALTSGGHP